MTTLTLMSDTHGLHTIFGVGQGQHAFKQPRIKVQACDILIHAGDLTENGSEQEFRDALEALCELPAEDLIVTCGNHDFFPWRYPHAAREIAREIGGERLKLLLDDGAYVRGLFFWGVPWCVRAGTWAYGLDDLGDMDSIEARLRYVPDDVQVLLTHSPPWGVLDYHEKHYGSRAIRNLTRRLPHLKLHVFGHIHEQGHSMKTGHHLSVNAAQWEHHTQTMRPPLRVQL